MQIALFHFRQTVYTFDNLEPGSAAQVLSHNILEDVQDEPIVISPLYKQRIRLHGGRRYNSGEQAVRAQSVKVETGKVWVGAQALILRAEAS